MTWIFTIKRLVQKPLYPYLFAYNRKQVERVPYPKTKENGVNYQTPKVLLHELHANNW